MRLNHKHLTYNKANNDIKYQICVIWNTFINLEIFLIVTNRHKSLTIAQYVTLLLNYEIFWLLYTYIKSYM